MTRTTDWFSPLDFTVTGPAGGSGFNSASSWSFSSDHSSHVYFGPYSDWMQDCSISRISKMSSFDANSPGGIEPGTDTCPAINDGYGSQSATSVGYRAWTQVNYYHPGFLDILGLVTWQGSGAVMQLDAGWAYREIFAGSSVDLPDNRAWAWAEANLDPAIVGQLDEVEWEETSELDYAFYTAPDIRDIPALSVQSSKVYLTASDWTSTSGTWTAGVYSDGSAGALIADTGGAVSLYRNMSLPDIGIAASADGDSGKADYTFWNPDFGTPQIYPVDKNYSFVVAHVALRAGTPDHLTVPLYWDDPDVGVRQDCSYVFNADVTMRTPRFRFTFLFENTLTGAGSARARFRPTLMQYPRL